MKSFRNILLGILILASTSLFAQKNFMAGWDGGNATGVGSEPNNFGWLCDVEDFGAWDIADSEIGGMVRYSTVLASECAIFDSIDPDALLPIPLYYDNNRLLIIRWDGNFVNYYAYKLKNLKAGATYDFSWVYAWYNNGDECILRVGVNKNPYSTITDNTDWEIGEDENDDIYYEYFFEIMDDLVGPNDFFPYEQKKTVHPSSFKFSVPEDGDYYITITSSDVVKENFNEVGSPIGPMAMVGGFSVVESGTSSINSSSLDNVDITVVDRKIKVEGSDNYVIISLTGQEVDKNSSLIPGLYIVVVNNIAHKVLVK